MQCTFTEIIAKIKTGVRYRFLDQSYYWCCNKIGVRNCYVVDEKIDKLARNLKSGRQQLSWQQQWTARHSSRFHWFWLRNVCERQLKPCTLVTDTPSDTTSDCAKKPRFVAKFFILCYRCMQVHITVRYSCESLSVWLMSIDFCWTSRLSCRWGMNMKRLTLNFKKSIAPLTRQLTYRKEDRAMRPIYGCPEKFRESSLRTRLLFPKFVVDFCSDRY